MNPVHVKILQWALCQLFGTEKGRGITIALTGGPFAEVLRNAKPTTVVTLFDVSAAVFIQNQRQTRTNDTGNE